MSWIQNAFWILHEICLSLIIPIFNQKSHMKNLPVMTLLCMYAFLWIACSSENGGTAKTQEKEITSRSTPTIDRIPLNEKLKMMQGTWKLKNSDQVLTISKRQFILSAGDSTLQSATVEAYENCPGFCSLGGDVSGISCFVVKGEYDATCYAIMNLSDDMLKCSLMGGEGIILEYERAD